MVTRKEWMTFCWPQGIQQHLLLISGHSTTPLLVTGLSTAPFAGHRAFNNSRTLAQQGAPLALLAILREGKVDTASLAAVCTAAKKVAANEEICKELADAGAVHTTMQVSRNSMSNLTGILHLQ